MSVVRVLSLAGLILVAGCQAGVPLRQAKNWNDTEANCVAAGKLTPGECKCVNGYMAGHISFENFSRQKAELINKPVDDWVVIDGSNKHKSTTDFMKESKVDGVRFLGEAMSACLPKGKQ
jgi:hypothetical protein